jgi:hypothetical protein
MAFQFSTAVRNAWLDAIEAAIGTSVTLEIRSGAAPANCAAADSGTVLATIALPADWMAAAAAGAKAMQGTWQDASADASGTAGHFRIKVGGTCHIQGSCSGIGGGGDMIIDNPALVATQQFNVTAFTLTASGA